MSGDVVLVLAAMPLELEPLLRAAEHDAGDTLAAGDRTLYRARLGGRHAVLAMTGIGMENASRTTSLALERLRGSVTAVVFCGVAGSTHRIGDVAVPEAWTADGGTTWLAADPSLVGAADDVRTSGGLRLVRTVAVPEGPSVFQTVAAGTEVILEHEPAVHVGGRGTSSDPFGDQPIPCIPGGGDVLGCAPAASEEALPPEQLRALLDAAFGSGSLDAVPPTTATYAAQDMESAAVAAVASTLGVPFLAVRAVSDGGGDPLGLPGFPAQFFAYRHLAATNAALVTEAVLEAAQ